MNLDGNQLKELHTALLYAFPSEPDLKMMVRFDLDENLAVITTGPNLSVMAFDLICWAEASGKIKKLSKVVKAYSKKYGMRGSIPKKHTTPKQNGSGTPNIVNKKKPQAIRL